MVHYILANDEQKEFAEGAKEIVSKELGPHIEEYENADGGLGMDAVTEACIIEAIGEVDAGFAFAFASASAQWPQILKTFMPEEEKQAAVSQHFCRKITWCPDRQEREQDGPAPV